MSRSALPVRHPRRALHAVWAVGVSLVWLAVLAGCGGSPEANATVSYEIGGDCATCPPSRLDTLLRRVAGVMDVTYDVADSRLTLRYDSTRVKSNELVALLNDAGYDADDALALLPSLVDRCCSLTDVNLDSLRKVDTLSLTPDQRSRLYALIEQAASGDAEELDLDGLDDESEDALTDATVDDVLQNELGGVLEDDLLGNADDREDDAAADDDDDDLLPGDDLDDEPKKPAKPDTTRKKRVPPKKKGSN